MAVEIIEVLRRSEQGITRPFICRGDDDEVYFVKGTGAGRRSQICEWVAGRLAALLELPVAPFKIVHVPEELLDPDMGIELDQLGAGPAFGSLEQRVTELTVSSIPEVADKLQQDVLIFDWWVRNGDRILTEKGGNPNLFWEPRHRGLVIIDHNQAFNAALDRQELIDFHVFRDQSWELAGDFFRRDEYNEKLANALDHLTEILEEIPAEWWYADPQMTVPTDFDRDAVHELLLDFRNDEFWRWR